MDLTFVKTTLQKGWEEELDNMDGDSDNICKAEFYDFLRKPAAVAALREVGVDVIGLVDVSDYLFAGDGKLSFVDFMDKLLELRGGNTVTVQDIVNLRKVILHDLPGMIGDVLQD